MYFLDIFDIKNWTDYDNRHSIFFYELNDISCNYYLGDLCPNQIQELQNVLCYLGCLDSELL